MLRWDSTERYDVYISPYFLSDLFDERLWLPRKTRRKRQLQQHALLPRRYLEAESRADQRAPKIGTALERLEKLREYSPPHEGLVQLRKAISMLEFIIQNESIESVKISYEDKIKELRGRLKNRE